MSWQEVTLGDCIEFSNGFAFKSKRFIDDPDGVPLIKGENLGKGRILWESSKYWDKTDAENYGRFFLEANDIVLAMDRTWVNGGIKYAMISEDDPRSLQVQRIGRLRAIRSIITPHFLRYIIASYAFAEYIRNVQGGVGVPHISPDQIKRFGFSLPPLPTQRRIASILSAYDDLIENNLKRIRLLEEAAQNIYREWFVEMRFPGWEDVKWTDDGEGRRLPEGWRYASLDSLCILTMGQSPKSEYYNEQGQGLPFHQGVTEYGFRFVKNKVYCTIEGRIAEPYDILCSVRAPVGRLNITLDKMIIGRGLSAIRNNDGFQSYQYYQLKSHFHQEDLIGGGAIFNSVTKKVLGGQELLSPTPGIVEQFEIYVKPIDRQIEVLYQQTEKCKEARDILLPRLMNRTIEV